MLFHRFSFFIRKKFFYSPRYFTTQEGAQKEIVAREREFQYKV